jgi:hypothetical protein
MKDKTKAVMAFGLLLVIVGAVYASYWIYSETKRTWVSGYYLTLNNLPSLVTRYRYVNLNGTLTMNGNGVSGATIYIYFNGTVVGTNTTNANGFYSYNFNETYPEGSELDFKAGYMVP